MENTILIALSHQDALRRQMEVVANNLANMNDTGFKAERMMFSEYVAKVRGDADDRPIFVRDVATVRDFSDGRLDGTGNPLDVALQGRGMFVVASPEGERYTRAGHFRLDSAGQIVTEQGMPVLSTAGQPIQVPAEDTSIGIAGDGTVATETGIIGRLRVVDFDNYQALRATGDGLYASKQPGRDLAQPLVVQGAVERANVEPILELEKMIRVHRAYEQTRGLIDREDDRIMKMLQAYQA